ncbi:MAG: 1-deoxy-D-xylulose-5-phosphate reductoisomerase, partial [Rhodobacteraceae bacterium]|nr:1-deoxy-D-xylulose-5-phosphate reductoisomerase [Paracoccaceae bacterium]
AAKERALDHFISERIGFLQMAEVVEEVLHRLSAQSGLTNAEMTLDSVLEMDHLARNTADEIIANP